MIPYIFIFLLIASLAMIVYLVAKHYQQLAVLDVDSLPEVKVAKKKDEYLFRKAEQEARRMNKKITKTIFPWFRKFKKIQFWFRKYVANIEKRAASLNVKKQSLKKSELTTEEEQQMRSLVNDANHALENGDLENAEKKYIAAIKINDRNKKAYGGLADVYYKRNHFEEAKQTYRFLLYIDPNNEHALLQLADIAEKEGKIDKAVNFYQQAVLINDGLSSRFAKLYDLLAQLGQYDTALEAINQALHLEPQNPKYLDNLVEVSIMVGDKKMASDAFHELRMVNPENQKLPVLKDKIDKMPS